MNKAIFFDKDGTLVKDIPYNVDPKKIKLFADVPFALKRLQDQGYKIFIISNQAGVSFGFFTEDALQDVSEAIATQLEKSGVYIQGFYYCPHHKDGKAEGYNIDCSCRKPEPGLLLKAAEEHNIDLSQSWMIGDILNDIEAGNKAGCRTILVNNGNETEWVLNENRMPDYTAASILETAIIIDNYGRPSESIYQNSPIEHQEVLV